MLRSKCIAATQFLALALSMFICIPSAHADENFSNGLNSKNFDQIVQEEELSVDNFDFSHITNDDLSTAENFLLDPRNENNLWENLDSLPKDEQLAVLFLLENDEDFASRVQNQQFPPVRYGYDSFLNNAAEFTACVINQGFSKCKKAKELADVASREAEIRYPGAGLKDGRGDAFRHCWWSASMTIDIDESSAQWIATNHEAFGKDDTKAQHEMDFYNNAQGRWAAVAANMDWRVAVKFCEDWSGNGILKTL